MTQHPIIILIGKKRTGKDTVAGELARYGYQPIAFADTVRDILLSVNPLVPNPYGGTAHLTTYVAARGWEHFKTAQPDEYRRLCRGLGSAVAAHDKYFMANTTARRVEIARRRGPVVVSDARFPREVRAIQALGNTTTVRIIRPGIPLDDHITETACDDMHVDDTISNNSTLAALQFRVKFLLMTVA